MTVLYHPHMSDTVAEIPDGADIAPWLVAGWVLMTEDETADDEPDTTDPEPAHDEYGNDDTEE